MEQRLTHHQVYLLWILSHSEKWIYIFMQQLDDSVCDYEFVEISGAKTRYNYDVLLRMFIEVFRYYQGRDEQVVIEMRYLCQLSLEQRQTTFGFLSSYSHIWRMLNRYANELLPIGSLIHSKKLAEVAECYGFKQRPFKTNYFYKMLFMCSTLIYRASKSSVSNFVLDSIRAVLLGKYSALMDFYQIITPSIIDEDVFILNDVSIVNLELVLGFLDIKQNIQGKNISFLPFFKYKNNYLGVCYTCNSDHVFMLNSTSSELIELDCHYSDFIMIIVRAYLNHKLADDTKVLLLEDIVSMSDLY